MPILDDIRDHEVLGREYKRGRKEGMAQGKRKLLRLIAEKRFGSLPPWVEARLAGLSEPEIEAMGMRLLETRTLDETFSVDEAVRLR